MVKRPLPLRGDVWLTELDPVVGKEIRKARPCLIVSPDSMNRHLDTVTIMPLTSGSRSTRFRVPAHFRNRDGLLLGDQIRTADRHRLKAHLGRIDDGVLSEALSVLRETFEE